MRICIMCEDTKIKKVRKDMKNENILNIPLSTSGELPATHWFCCLATDQDRCDRLLKSADQTTMEISEPKEFLEKWNLKIIGKFSVL